MTNIDDYATCKLQRATIDRLDDIQYQLNTIVVCAITTTVVVSLMLFGGILYLAMIP